MNHNHLAGWNQGHRQLILSKSRWDRNGQKVANIPRMTLAARA